MTKHYARKCCLRCGEEFQPTTGAQKYCCECRSKAAYERETEWHKAHPDRMAAIARTAYLKRRVLKTPATKICPHCGQQFAPTCHAQIWCSDCQPIVSKEQNRISAAQWNKDHPEKARQRSKEWAAAHPEKRTAMVKRWQNEHPDRVRRMRHRAHAKRRTLAFVPMNQPFIGSEGHHINSRDVIYIPQELHKSIKHNIWTGHNMAEINAAACNWLTEDWT